jgi:purine-cytosine permease-like protein
MRIFPEYAKPKDFLIASAVNAILLGILLGCGEVFGWNQGVLEPVQLWFIFLGGPIVFGAAFGLVALRAVHNVRVKRLGLPGVLVLALVFGAMFLTGETVRFENDHVQHFLAFCLWPSYYAVVALGAHGWFRLAARRRAAVSARAKGPISYQPGATPQFMEVKKLRAESPFHCSPDGVP